MGIKQLEEVLRELKKEKTVNEFELHTASRVLEKKRKDEKRKRPECIPTRFEHMMDVGEEF